VLLLERDGRGAFRKLDLADALIRRYDRDGNGKLNRNEIALSRAEFDRLDLNRDGELDALELMNWTVDAPVLEATIRLGKTDPSEALLDVKAADGKGITVRKASSSAFTVLTHGTQLRLVRGEVLPGGNTLRLTIERQVQALDPEGKGLREGMLPPGSVLQQIHGLADRDGDGVLTRRELADFLDLLDEGMQCAVTLGFTEQGRGLFELLDADGDGRLNLHELRTAWARLAPFDADGDGCISRDEIPRQFQLVAQPGVANFVALQREALRQPGVVAVPPPATRGPLWFRKMDVNGDGFVSEREFLGPREEFRKIDTDGDGLISVEGPRPTTA
jgi:Ca2+-binding EF-hand superfamily protein